MGLGGASLERVAEGVNKCLSKHLLPLPQVCLLAVPDGNSTGNAGIAQPAACFPGEVSGFPGSLELPVPWISKEKTVAPV